MESSGHMKHWNYIGTRIIFISYNKRETVWQKYRYTNKFNSEIEKMGNYILFAYISSVKYKIKKNK